MTNGNTPLSMRINPGFEKDPLRPKRHHVVASTNGKDFFVLGEPGQQFVTDPIELLKLEVQGNHAVGMPAAEIRIMDDDRQEVARFESYYVDPEDGPPSEERLHIRNRWMDAIFRFLLPLSLFEVKDDPAKAKVLARWFKKNRIAIEMRPDGGAVRIYRNGDVLSQWGC